MSRTPKDNAFWDRSGRAIDQDPLTNFLYLLMRDEVVSGRIEEIMDSVEASPDVQYTNGWLYSHAKDVATRLRAAP